MSRSPYPKMLKESLVSQYDSLCAAPMLTKPKLAENLIKVMINVLVLQEEKIDELNHEIMGLKNGGK